MITESELNFILVKQKDNLNERINNLSKLNNLERIKEGTAIYKSILLLLPLWDSCCYHYKAVEVITRLNEEAHTNFQLPHTTKEGGL